MAHGDEQWRNSGQGIGQFDEYASFLGKYYRVNVIEGNSRIFKDSIKTIAWETKLCFGLLLYAISGSLRYLADDHHFRKASMCLFIYSLLSFLCSI